MTAPAQPVQVVDLLADRLVWTIIQRFVHSSPTAGSQLGHVGVGRASSACLGMAGTVGQKLARSPMVERIVWLRAGADFVESVIRPHVEHGQSPEEEIGLERRELADVLFEFGVGKEGTDESRAAKEMLNRARRLERSVAFPEQWTLLVCELSACWYDEQGGSSFRAWALGEA